MGSVRISEDLSEHKWGQPDIICGLEVFHDTNVRRCGRVKDYKLVCSSDNWTKDPGGVSADADLIWRWK